MLRKTTVKMNTWNSKLILQNCLKAFECVYSFFLSFVKILKVRKQAEVKQEKLDMGNNQKIWNENINTEKNI